VHQHNQQADFNPNITKMNLQGFLVGNGATQWDYDVSPSFPGTISGFNLIPRNLTDFFKKNNCTYFFNDFRPHSGPAECD
jgi:hypothetical protein